MVDTLKLFVTGSVILLTLLVAILVAGCINATEDTYTPPVELTVYSKYIEGNQKMVCTSMGTFRVYGAMGQTSVADDSAAYYAIPLNQPIKVRLSGKNLWWGWDNPCQNKGCSSNCCYSSWQSQTPPVTTSPTPIPTTAGCPCGRGY
jgi:hypothetical protein